MSLPEPATRLTELAGTAFGAKKSLDSFWQDAAELHFPEHADFTDRRDADDYESNLYDSTPAMFRRDFGNWLGSVLRPKGRDWFKGKLGDEELDNTPSVRSYLEARDRGLRGLMYDHKSLFIQSNVLADHQYVTFGNSVSSVEPRKTRDGLLYRTWHLKDCAWLDNEEGQTDTMFRKLTYTVRDLCVKERQGWDIPTKVKEKLEKDPTAKVNCLHVEMPIDHYYQGAKPKKKDADFVSVYVCQDTKDILFEEERSGFRYIVSRWFRLPNSPYAISPCVTSSNPDARTLQSMTWSIMQAGELAVEPPLVGQSETVLGPVNLFPGGVTWVDKRYDERMGAGLRPLDMGKVPELGVSLHGGIREQLANIWYLNKLFLPQTDHEMTAQETERRWQEFLRASQPIIEPAEPERNGRILDATMQAAIQMGRYGTKDDMPEELDGKDIAWSYDNPIEDARKQGTLAAFQSAMQVTEAAAQADPTVKAHFSVKKAHRETMMAIAPVDWLVPEDDEGLEAAEQQILEGVQQQATMDELQQGAGIAGELAKVEQSGVAA